MPGALLEELARVDSILKCRFPPAARLLYRLCNGQSILHAELDVEEEYQEDAHFVGLIRGYNFSYHYANVHLLSLRQVMSLTNHIPPLHLKQKSAQPYPQRHQNAVRLMGMCGVAECSVGQGLTCVGVRSVKT